MAQPGLRPAATAGMVFAFSVEPGNIRAILNSAYPDRGARNNGIPLNQLLGLEKI
jgi:hypothetical protein